MFLYLAAPYWSDNALLRGRRARDTSRLAARLMEAGFTVFSPISHGVGIAPFVREDFRNDNSFWLAQDFDMLSYATILAVHCLEGWQHSNGVQREIEEAQRLSLPLEYLSGDQEDVDALAGRYPHLTDSIAKVIPNEVGTAPFI